MIARPPKNKYNMSYCKVKPYIGKMCIARYTIYRDTDKVETDIQGYKTALAHARKWQYDLFHNTRKVEILNQWTGEIVSLEEAEKRYKEWQKKQLLIELLNTKEQANSATT